MNVKNVKKKMVETSKWIIKKFTNIHQFCNEDINEFILLLRKGFILMNTWIAGKDLMKHNY